jgi:hypothetical protein
MKKLFILMAFIAPIYVYGQKEIRIDIIEVDDQIYFRGDTLGAYILDLVSGDLTTASNGITKDDQDFKLGGSFDENTTITGGGNNINLGTSTNRMNIFNVYSSTSMNLDTDGDFTVNAAGNEWSITDDYLKVQRFGTTDTMISIREVRELINESQLFLPFNYVYNYSTLIVNERPGAGNFRFNSATYSNVTQIYIDAFDKSSEDKSNFIVIADTGAFVSISDGTNYINYKINGPISDSGNYITYNVEYLNNSGVITGECQISVDMSSIGSGSITVDTANYGRGAAINEIEFINNDTTLGSEYQKNKIFIVNADNGEININLPDAALVNYTDDVKEIIFILYGKGQYTLNAFNGQTINEVNTLTNNVNNSSVSIIPTSDTTWALKQDSRGEPVKVFGFPDYSNSYTILSFDDATRYFKIEPVGGDFLFYQDGSKYTIDVDSIQIPDIEGLHTIYYDQDSIKTIYQANESQIRDIYRNFTIVSQIYWNATDDVHLYLGNQRHTYNINPFIHEYLHFTLGALYSTGINITGITPDGDGDFDTTAQFNVTSGGFNNEDIFETTPSIQKGDNIPIYYLSGTLNLARRIYEPGFPVLTDMTAGVGSTGRLVYNDVETGTLVTVTNNNFVLCHIFALNNIADSLKIFAVVGQNKYALKADAEDGALVEGKEILKRAIPGRESILLYSIIYQTSDSYANSVKARVVSATNELGDPVDFIDWRGGVIGGGSKGGESAGSFLDLSDTPNSYSGDGDKILFVNNAETSVEFRENTFKDSAGVVSVVHNTSFDSVVAAKAVFNDSVTTSKIKSPEGYDILIEKKYFGSNDYLNIGTGLDNDFDIKLLTLPSWTEYFGLGINRSGSGSNLYINTYGGFTNLTTDLNLDGHFRIASEDTLWIGTKSDNPIYIIKPTGTTEYTTIYSSTTPDYIQLGGEGVGQININSPNLYLTSTNGGYLSLVDRELDVRVIDFTWRNTSNNPIATLSTSTSTFNIDNIITESVQSDSIVSDSATIDKIKGDTMNVSDKAEFNGEIEINWYEETYSSTKSIDFTDGNPHNRYITLTGNITINITGLPYGTSTLEINQDATGSHTISVGSGWGTKYNTLEFDTGSEAGSYVQFVKSPSRVIYTVFVNQN